METDLGRHRELYASEWQLVSVRTKKRGYQARSSMAIADCGLPHDSKGPPMPHEGGLLGEKPPNLKIGGKAPKMHLGEKAPRP